MSAPARNLLEVGRRIQRPTIFRSHFVEPEEFTSTDTLVARLRELAGGKPISFRPGFAHYPDFDPFRVLTAFAGGQSFAYVADRWHDDQDRAAGLRTLELAL